MNKYKFRAECSHDVVEFIIKIRTQLINFKMDSVPGFPDVEFEFETELRLDKIITVLKSIGDSHVMYQTVKPLAEYTGERNYSLN